VIVLHYVFVFKYGTAELGFFFKILGLRQCVLVLAALHAEKNERKNLGAMCT
jgi:hypothetical protein